MPPLFRSLRAAEQLAIDLDIDQLHLLPGEDVDRGGEHVFDVRLEVDVRTR